MDAAVVEAAVEKRLAAVGSIIETWRRAVEAKELEIGALAAKIDELEASAANHAENSGTTNGDDELAARLDAAEREVRDAADKLAAALLASEDPARTDLAPISKTKKMPLRVAADAAVARLAYLAKRAEVHESETRGRAVDARTHEAAMAKADARLAELRARAQGERGIGRESSRRRRAVGGGEGERGGGVREVRRRPSRRGAHRGGAEGARRIRGRLAGARSGWPGAGSDAPGGVLGTSSQG